MPDISMCANGSCPLRKTCYRFNSTPNPYRQTYSQFDWKTNESGEPICNYFWPIKT